MADISVDKHSFGNLKTANFISIKDLFIYRNSGACETFITFNLPPTWEAIKKLKYPSLQ